MPQAYPPQRGSGKRATKENARTASLAVVRWDFLEAWTQASAGEDGDALSFWLHFK
jgi:hypothetical protein